MLIIPFTFACSGKSTLPISQLREDVLVGTADGITACIYPELREIPLCADGYCGEKTPVLIIKLTRSSAFSGTYSVFVNLDGKEYSATAVQKNPTLLRAEIILPSLPQGTVTVMLKGEAETEITAHTVKADGICTYTKALTTAKSALGDKVAYDGKTALGEFMVRLLWENNTAYWYVGYTKERYTHSLLISADGSKLLATHDAENT
jgi:hypothetical protein